MASRARSLALCVVTAIACGACTHGGPARSHKSPSCLSGTYDGGQTEVATGLALGSDGRFAYGLSYGALDEGAGGRWEADGDRVYLTSDPVKPPALAFVAERASDQAGLYVELDVTGGLSRQYFDARIELADGQSLMRRFEEDGLYVEFAEGDRPVSTTVLLPMFGVASMPYRLTGDGPRIVLFRFDPNDLGKVAFSRTPLMREGARLILERHGRRLTFRPVKGGCGNGQPD